MHSIARLKWMTRVGGPMGFSKNAKYVAFLDYFCGIPLPFPPTLTLLSSALSPPLPSTPSVPFPRRWTRNLAIARMQNALSTIKHKNETPLPNIYYFMPPPVWSGQRNNVLDLSNRSFVRPCVPRSVRSSVRPCVPRSVRSFFRCWIVNTQYYENERIDFNANWYKWSTRQGDTTVNLGGQEVKGQVHRKPKLELEAWRRHHSRPLESSR